jgi:hypothetical protein
MVGHAATELLVGAQIKDPTNARLIRKCVVMRTTRFEGAAELPGGAGCQEQNLPAKGKVFLLDIPFYRTRRARKILPATLVR